MRRGEMNVEKAIRTAIEYEHRVRGVYDEAAEKAGDPVGRRVFTTLRDEEHGHVAYLENCLLTWLEKGIVTGEGLQTVVPSLGTIRAGIDRLRSEVEPRGASEAEVALLRRALEVEVETSRFYADLVLVLPPEGRKLFQRFVEIEGGHQAIVQAEIDSVTGLGYWFDFQEFKLEAG